MLKKDTMKKQFLRVKQLANQNFGRAEKTEVLSDELLQCEKKIETLKHVSHNTTKKLSVCLQGQGQDYDRRLKKLPDSHLAASMMESSQMLGNNSILGSMLATCGECQQNIAKDLTVYDMEVEAKVLDPLNKLAEVDIPNVYAQKKRLSKATLDMDSARSRHLSALRATTAGRSNLPEHVAKIDQLKEEMDEADSKMVSTRDSYVTEMLALLARESEYSEKLVALVEEQVKYHKNAAANLDQMLPAMKSLLLENPQQKVFGTDLAEHLRVVVREIAFPLEACCEAILQMGVDEEGLFRIAGASSKVKKLRASFDVGIPDMTDYIEIGQVHAITGVLKQYLRELPEPLMTFALYDEWVSANSVQDKDARLQSLWTVVNKLPKPNFDNLRYLIKFLHKLLQYSEVTKMTSSNLSLVIGPNILWSQDDSISMMSTGTASCIVDSLITHAEWFFPGEIDFGTLQIPINKAASDENIPEHTQSLQTTPQPVRKTASVENLLENQEKPERPERPDSSEQPGNPTTSNSPTTTTITITTTTTSTSTPSTPEKVSPHQTPDSTRHRKPPPPIPTNKPALSVRPSPRPRPSVKRQQAPPIPQSEN